MARLTHASVLGVHENLTRAARFPRLFSGQSAALKEMALLMLAGAAAALALVFLNWKLRIPGHAILRSVLPLSLGLALVPRRLAGSVMGLSGWLTALALSLFGFGGLGLGAIASLLLCGPFLDLALWRARQGWHIYLAFAGAGLASNLVAWTVRAGPKILGLDRLGTRPLEEWWLGALLSYSVCGVLAGVFCALVCYRFKTIQGREQPQ